MPSLVCCNMRPGPSTGLSREVPYPCVLPRVKFHAFNLGSLLCHLSCRQPGRLALGHSMRPKMLVHVGQQLQHLTLADGTLQDLSALSGIGALHQMSGRAARILGTLSGVRSHPGAVGRFAGCGAPVAASFRHIWYFSSRRHTCKEYASDTFRGRLTESSCVGPPMG